MKIAITAENDNGFESTVAHHFGGAPYFVLVELENGQVAATQCLANPFADHHKPGQIPNFVREQNAEVIISGGMGGRAIQFFEGYGIKTATGADGTVGQALENYLDGKLTEAAPCDESVAHGHG